MKEALLQYRKEMYKELEDILRYWMEFTIDEAGGGFIGRIDGDNQKHPDAAKGSVLNSRILWSFSAAYNLKRKKEYAEIATRAYSYILNHFIDKEFGGVYWTVTAEGEPLDTKKQIYALSFAIYGFAEYYKTSGNEEARSAAIQLYRDMVAHSYDAEHGGYKEALSRDWKELEDMRLSEKDANESKSMNTHLHVLEGFTSLYRIWPDEELKQKIYELAQLFLTNIISNTTHHLILFFEDDWKPKSRIISYGHDIEAAWLLQEAAGILGDQILLLQVKNCSVKIAEAATRGLDKDGGLWYEYDAASQHLIKQKHWWPQGEAMVGFFNTWQNAGDAQWFNHSVKSWQFVQQFIKDKNGGEWRWGINNEGSPMSSEDKVGLWKCPYHNSRTCIQIIQRINSITG